MASASAPFTPEVVSERDAQRFMDKTDTSGDCWLWKAGMQQAGYGMFWVGGNTVLAHRISWVIRNGAIPSGLSVLHKCDRPRCVNPDHLFLGTQADNVSDSVSKGRRAVGERHGRAKLSADDVLAIRSRYSRGGVTQLQLANIYGVSQGLIFFIVARKKWAHLPTPAAT